MSCFILLQFSARDYLETALMPVAGSGAAVEAKNGIRASIKSLFPDRDCATLVRPMHEEAVSWVLCCCLGKAFTVCLAALGGQHLNSLLSW